MADEAKLYEAMYILDVGSTDDVVEQVGADLQQVLADNGGEFVSDELYGRRRLAYKIGDCVEGFYRILYFRGEPTLVIELKRTFLVDDRIVRGMVVVTNPKAIFVPRPPRPVEPEPAAAESAPEAEVPAEVAEAAPAVPEAEAPAEVEAVTPAEAALAVPETDAPAEVEAVTPAEAAPAVPEAEAPAEVEAVTPAEAPEAEVPAEVAEAAAPEAAEPQAE